MENIIIALSTLGTETLTQLIEMKAGDIRRCIASAIDQAERAEPPVQVDRDVRDGLIEILRDVPFHASQDPEPGEVLTIRPEQVPEPTPEPVKPEPKPPKPEPKPVPKAEGDGFTIMPGSVKGFVEIRFADKPDQKIRAELKLADFRFTKKVFKNGKAVRGEEDPRWYGKVDQLPERYQSVITNAA